MIKTSGVNERLSSAVQKEAGKLKKMLQRLDKKIENNKSSGSFNIRSANDINVCHSFFMPSLANTVRYVTDVYDKQSPVSYCLIILSVIF